MNKTGVDAVPARKFRPLGKLILIFLASLGLYLIMAVKYPLASSLANPRASWVSLVGNDLPWIAFQVLIYFCLFFLYTQSIRQVLPSARDESQGDPIHSTQLRRVNQVIILGWGLYCAVLITSAAAGESHDIFDYVFRGRMMVEYQANPLIEIPKSYDRAHYYLYTAWYRNVDTYGPLWEMASAGVAAVVHSAASIFGRMPVDLPSCPESPDACRWLVVYLSAYRLLAILLTGLSAVIIARIVKPIQPALVSAALAAWLWNPLTLVASAVGGHNDFWMLFFFLASLWLLQKEKFFLALLALVLSAHVKITALIWAPLILLWIIRKSGWRSGFWIGIRGLAAGLIVSWALYLPFDGWTSLPQMLNERTLYFANSIWTFFYRVFIGQQGWLAWVGLWLTQNLPNLISVAGATIIPLRNLNFIFKPGPAAQMDGGDRALYQTATAVGLFYLLGGAFWFQHWYLLWVLGPAVLLANRSFTLDINPWLGFGALTGNFLGGFLLGTFPDGLQRNLGFLAIVIVIWAPGLAAYWMARRSGR